MRAASALSLTILLGCSSSSTTPDATTPHAGTTCVDGGATIALGGECLTLTSVRARVGGAWRAVPAADVKVTRLDGARVTIGAHAKGAEAFEVVLDGARGAAMLEEGYQSWGFSGAVVAPESVPMDADGSIAAAAARTGSPLDEARGVSYGAAIVGDPGSAALAIGATSARIATTAIAATRAAGASSTRITVLYGAAREALGAGPSSDVAMEDVGLAARPSGAEAVDALGELLNAGVNSPTSGAMRGPTRPPGGWYSWNQLFADVTEKDVVDHVAIAKEKLLPKGMRLVEIDDGWEGLWGDWTANAKFPSGMDGLAKTITGAGLVAGVWLAPFLVDVESEAAKKADPSWFVRGSDDKPLVHQPSGLSRKFFVLDGTNPKAMEVAAGPIRAMAKAGFGFFKLDYLYAGALPGNRGAPATGTMALEAGLATLRTAMGDSAVLNACGAPILPVLGLADSVRVGTDTAFAPLSLAWADVAFAARSLSARAFLAEQVWLDADQAQLRAPYTADEAKASAVVAAMAGPAYALGDDLRKLPTDRLAIALDPAIVDLAGASAPARAIDPLESPVETIVSSPIVDTIASGGSTGAPPPSRFTIKGASGATTTIAFDWTGARSVTLTK
jgi:alpha-galactosidase